MAKRRLGLIATLFCFFVCITAQTALAANTQDAKEPIRTEENCNLTIQYSCEDTVFPNETITLYKVADVSSDFQYTLTPKFAGTDLVLNGIQTTKEWDVIRCTLDTHVLGNNLAEDVTGKTADNGKVCFTDLTPGLYLAVSGQFTVDELTCYFDSALVSLPGLNEDGFWNYDICVSAKPQVVDIGEPEYDLEFSVLKLWKNDDAKTNRPKSIEVEIFRNQESVETVTLSEDNHWCYHWIAPDDGAKWNVVERNIPEGYTMTVQKETTTFILTNTLTTTPPPNTPGTGDSVNILLYIVLMNVSGIALVILGIAGKKKRL